MGNKESRRPKGSGSIYRHGAKFMARWVVDGKVHKRSTGETTERAALKKLAEFTAPFRLMTEKERIEAMRVKLTGIEAELKKIDDSRRALPIAGAIEAYRKSAKRHECTEATFDNYRGAYADFCAWIANAHPDTVLLRDVTQDQTSEYLSTIRDLSPNTYNKRIVLFRSMWAVLADEAGIKTNPWLSAAKRRLDTVRKRALSVEEIQSLLSAAEGETKTLFMLGLFTGLRLGDCVRLEWNAVRFIDGYIALVPHKTSTTSRAIVEIPLLPELRSELQSLAGFSIGRGPILPTLLAAFNHSESSFHRNAIEPVFKRAGITSSPGLGRRRDVGFHSLRHTFVTICALHGVPLNVVQSIVGHTTVQMTEYYAHTNRATAIKEVGRAFVGLLSPPQSKDVELSKRKDSPALSRVLRAAMALSPEDRAALVSRLTSSHA